MDEHPTKDQPMTTSKDFISAQMDTDLIKSLGKYAEAVGPVLHPDTAISQVVVHLTESRNNLPVVDEASGKLVGMVSYWDIIGRILGDK